jgi:KDEL-tailed cysteine endopeptidase
MKEYFHSFFFLVWYVAIFTAVIFLIVQLSGSVHNGKQVSEEKEDDGIILITPDTELAFDKFSVQYKLKFDSAADKKNRLQQFARNQTLIDTHNVASIFPWTLSHNSRSHLTLEEHHTSLGFSDDAVSSRNASSRIYAVLDTNDLPETFDWCQHGAVTPVHNQGNCGACYAFAALDALSSAMFINNQPLVDLAVQELVDCDSTNRGCVKGSYINSFDTIRRNRGVCPAASYLFTGDNGTCDSKCEAVLGSQVQQTHLVVQSERELMAAVAQQPVVVAIHATGSFFQLYDSGVFTAVECDGNVLNHAVLLVGYGVDTESKLKYWKIKNSWGPEWGMDGYMLLERGGTDGGFPGTCGILKRAVFPSVV